MLDAAGWTLPSLVTEHGARTAYRITRESGRVRLEGCHGPDTCLLSSVSPAATVHSLLGGPLRLAAPNPPSHLAICAPAHLAPEREPKESWTMFA